MELHEHSYADITGNGLNYWTAENGTHSVMAWVDDTNLFHEVNERNNQKTISINIPFAGVSYFDHSDTPDPLDNPVVNDILKPAILIRQTHAFTAWMVR
ncbi:hypothetical protein [Hoylesella nanceiensis]